MEDKIGIGMIGAGFARRVQIPAFCECEGAEVVSVASRTIESARSTAEEFSIGHFTDNWRETIEHQGVDLVCITSPPDLHREMVLAAIDAGKHIVAEKPMAMNVAEAEEMTLAAQGKNVLALIDHELRFLPGRLKAFEMLREGAIGKVLHAKYNFRAPHRGDPSVPWNWWSDVEAGGGALGAINSHVIDSFNWFLGTEISSVYCQLQTHIKRRPFGDEIRTVTTDDEANMLLRFRDGELTQDATGLVSVSMIEGPGYTNRIEFFGTEGWMRVDHRGDIHIAKQGEDSWTAIEVEYPPGIEGVFESGFPSGFMAFSPKLIAAIRSGDSEIPYAATFEDGLKVQRVLDAARESSDAGKRIDFSAPASGSRGV